MEEIHIDRFRDRQSKGIFTEVHIAKLTNLPIQLEKETQTTPFIQPKQLRFPMKTPSGVDMAIQVHESDIFNFDRESAPIVKNLVHNILEEAKLEAWNEGETEYLRNHQVFLNQMDGERMQKMRDFEKNEREKRKEARLANLRKAEQKQKLQESHKKLLGRELSKSYIQILYKQTKRQVGHLAFKEEERATDQIQNEVMTQVEERIFQQIDRKGQVQGLLEKVIFDVHKLFRKSYAKGREKYTE